MKITDELLEQYAPEAAEQLLAKLPEDADIPPHRFSPEFERAVRRMDRKAKPQWMGWLRKVAAVLVICLGLVGFAQTSAGAYVYERIWTTVQLHLSPDAQKAVTPISFVYLPEELTLSTRDELPEGGWVFQFIWGEEGTLTVVQRPVSEGERVEITYDGSMEEHIIDGQSFYLFWELDSYGLYCVRGGCEIIMSGDVPPEELLQIGAGIIFAPA